MTKKLLESCSVLVYVENIDAMSTLNRLDISNDAENSKDT